MTVQLAYSPHRPRSAAYPVRMAGNINYGRVALIAVVAALPTAWLTATLTLIASR